MGFVSPVKLERTGLRINGRAEYRLMETLVYECLTRSCRVAGLSIRVPKHSCTDLASVPRLLWLIFPPDGPWAEAAVLHDYLCGLPGCSRFLADAIFRDAMKSCKVPLWRRVIAYYAVRFYAVITRIQ